MAMNSLREGQLDKLLDSHNTRISPKGLKQDMCNSIDAGIWTQSNGVSSYCCQAHQHKAFKDLFSQCTCVRTYMSVTLRNVNLHSFALTCKGLMCHMHDDGGACRRGMRSRLEDREERHFLTMEDREDSAAAPPQCTCFVESSAERSQRLAMLRNRMQCTKEVKSKKAKENKRNCKGRKHVVESLHKPGIKDARFHVRFNRSPSD